MISHNQDRSQKKHSGADEPSTLGGVTGGPAVRTGSSLSFVAVTVSSAPVALAEAVAVKTVVSDGSGVAVSVGV
jgi:hypothetical protein